MLFRDSMSRWRCCTTVINVTVVSVQGSPLEMHDAAFVGNFQSIYTSEPVPSSFSSLQGSPLEMHVAPYFVEDRGPGQPSYADWVLSLYKGVMAK
jgi:hypothetical protein